MRFALLLVLALVTGCSGGSPSPAPPPVPPVSVSPGTLYRDRQTARSYAGVRVRFTLPAGCYAVEPGRLCVTASMPGGTPVLVVRHPHAMRDSSAAVEVVGVCRGPTVDGVWRTAYADFFVTVDAEAVTTLTD